MTQDYVAGELSVRLEQLQSVAPQQGAARVAQLRRDVESCPLSWLTAAITRALALAEGLCWDSLSQGDIAAFARQASICADLQQFGICSRLLADDPRADAGEDAPPQ
jgi:hypothetical protein